MKTLNARNCAQVLREEVAKAQFGIRVHPRATSNDGKEFVLTFCQADGRPNGRLCLEGPDLPELRTRIAHLLPEFQSDNIEAVCEQANEKLKDLVVGFSCTQSEDQLTKLIAEADGDFPEPYTTLEFLATVQIPGHKEVVLQVYFELDYLLPKETYNKIIALQ